VLLLAFLVLEVLLRVLGLRALVLYEHDAAAGYRLKPGQQVRPLGTRIVVNRWGVRDPRPLAGPPPDDARRILTLGDSVTWGGVRMPQAALFTARLEALLGDAQVVNAGVNGYSVTQMTRLYEAHLQELEPDLVLVCAIPRDFERPPVVRLPGDTLAFPMRRPALALTVAARLLAARLHDLTGGALFAQPPQPVPEGGAGAGPHHVGANAAALKALAEQLPEGTALRLVLLPTRAPDPELAAAIHDALDGVAVTDLHAAMTPEPAWFTDAVHLTREGHAAVAAALAEALAEPRTGSL
jgi:lysophospholipase L1-like esterase